MQQRGRQPSENDGERATGGEIKALRAKSRGLYGSPKIYRQLRRDGEVVNHKRVEKLMKARYPRKESSGFA
jgi:hypothetical protein